MYDHVTPGSLCAMLYDTPTSPSLHDFVVTRAFRGSYLVLARVELKHKSYHWDEESVGRCLIASADGLAWIKTIDIESAGIGITVP